MRFFSDFQTTVFIRKGIRAGNMIFAWISSHLDIYVWQLKKELEHEKVEKWNTFKMIKWSRRNLNSFTSPLASMIEKPHKPHF